MNSNKIRRMANVLKIQYFLFHCYILSKQKILSLNSISDSINRYRFLRIIQVWVIWPAPLKSAIRISDNDRLKRSRYVTVRNPEINYISSYTYFKAFNSTKNIIFIWHLCWWTTFETYLGTTEGHNKITCSRSKHIPW